jgi:hypothetical protein
MDEEKFVCCRCRKSGNENLSLILVRNEFSEIIANIFVCDVCGEHLSRKTCELRFGTADMETIGVLQ